MRLTVLLLTLFLSASANAQIFWSENFGTGCNTGQLISAYSGTNGVWTSTSTGTNAASASVWYVSAAENGMQPGQCGMGCGNNQTLHIGAVDVGVGADPGAAYYEGLAGFCGILPCGATSKRADSPTINCSGHQNISLRFSYIEGGNVIDNATLWYFNGSSWSQLADMAKTFSATCSGQGLWTLFTIDLPASANNNSNVKIGFRWDNNEDGDATDPSFAVDDISLQDAAVTDLIPPTISCPVISFGELDGTCSYTIPDYSSESTYTDNLDNNLTFTQNPAAGSTVSSNTTVVCTVTDDAGNSASCNIDLQVFDPILPQITCPNDQIVVSSNNSANVIVPIPVIVENCSGYNLTNNFNNTANASSVYPAGYTDVQFTVTDAFGNTATCNTVITVLTTSDCCPPDLNCDGFIGIGDLILLINNFGCLNGCLGDLNEDNIVGVDDLLIFNNSFGSFCP